MSRSFRPVFGVVCFVICLFLGPDKSDSRQFELKVESTEFGVSKSGEAVRKYTCTNENGITLTLIDYGATICQLQLPDKNGKFVNVVLGCDTLAQYESQTSYLGATIGRYCNRIANARFEIDGQAYELAKNNGEHHLHGGDQGWNRAVWKSQSIEKEDSVGVVFTHVSPDGDEGYPGEVKATVTYELNNDDRLTIQYEAQTDKATHLNLTNHAYFNLAGSGSILDHQLRINADTIIAVNDQVIPTGELEAAKGSPFDFTQWHRMGLRMEELGEGSLGYDQSYVLPGKGKLFEAAAVIEPNSGRKMIMSTTFPSIEFYTGNYLNGTKTSGGHERHSGFCLEAMGYADAPNQSAFPSTLLKPDETYRETVQLSFSVAIDEEMEAATKIAEEISLVKMIQHNADLVVTDIGKQAEFAFGYDEVSLKWLETYINLEKVNWDETKRSSMLNLLGSYFGECVRRNHGGKWIQSDSEGTGVEIAEGFVVFPFNKVEKFIDNGDGDSFVSLYNSIAVMKKLQRQRLLESQNKEM
jgi:aldose 1-epimerase